MQLHGFFRSGTSHRLRIALNLKGVSVQQVGVDLRQEAHLLPAFKALNPQGLVPVLVLDDGQVMAQSPAILEWLEERHPSPPLLPADPERRARVRALAAIVGCDIHPVNNRRILEALRHEYGADPARIDAWCSRWIGDGFDAYDAWLATDGDRGRFSLGDAPSMADVYLVPQIESARRFKVDMARWPRIQAIERACLDLEAFRRAAPAAQPDAS